MKKITYHLIVALLLLGLLNSLNAHSRMDRLSWTDRGISNPPLSQSASIDSTIETFWNVTLTEDPVVEPRAQVRVSNSNLICSASGNVPSTQVEQDRSTHERRGYFGINLFNAIPLIDIVHGNVSTDSKDNVKGRR
jgi:hypothetical protein